MLLATRSLKSCETSEIGEVKVKVERTYGDAVVSDSSSPSFTDGWWIFHMVSSGRNTVKIYGT